MSRTVARKRPVQVHEVDENGDVILHDSTSGQMVVLNAVGAATFELIDGKRDTAEIVDELASVFADIDRDVIARDVAAFVQDLSSRGLLSVETTGPG